MYSYMYVIMIVETVMPIQNLYQGVCTGPAKILHLVIGISKRSSYCISFRMFNM